MNNSEIEKNQRAVKHAIAQQEIEELTVPQSTVDDLNRVARGEITSTEAIRNILARYDRGGNVEIFQQ